MILVAIALASVGISLQPLVVRADIEVLETEVKSAGIAWHVNAESGVNTSKADVANWAAPCKVRIIGTFVDAEINNHFGNWDSGVFQGRIALCANLSLSPTRERINIFNQAEAIVMACLTTDGGQSIPTVIGVPYNFSTVMYPAGHGMDLEAGEKIYLHAGWENLMLEIHQLGASVVIYYVEVATR